MPFKRVRVARTSQPQDVCGLDRSNQLYRHLSRVLVPKGIKYLDLISGETFNNASDATFTVSPNQGGVGRRTNSTSLNTVTPIPQLQETISNVAYVWAGVVHAAGGTTYPFVRNNQFSVSASSASNPVYSCRAGSTTNRTGTTPIILKKPTTFGFGKKGSEYTFIVDGKVELSGTDAGAASLTTWAVDSNSGFAQSNDITTNLVLIFKTGDAEILKAAVDNPYQVFEPESRWVFFSDEAGAGGVTQVIGDLAAIYDIRAAATSDLSAAYAVRGAIAGDLGAAYDIRAAAAQDLDASYLVRGASVADLAGTYDIRGAISADAAASYPIRGAVNADLAASYDIQGAGTVASDLVCSYMIRGTVAADLEASYLLRGLVSTDLPAAYDIRSAVSADLVASYAVDGALSAVFSDLTCIYMIDGVAVACPTAEEIAAAVITAAQASPLHADVRAIRGLAIVGSGQVGDEFGVA